MLLLSNGLEPSDAIRGVNDKKALANAKEKNHIFTVHNGLVHVNSNVKSYRRRRKDGTANYKLGIFGRRDDSPAVHL
jgi:hypothetical protein